MLHFGSAKQSQNEQNSTNSISNYLKCCSIGVQIVACIIVVGFILVGIICWASDVNVVIGSPEPLPQSNVDNILPIQKNKYSNSFASYPGPNNVDSGDNSNDYSSARAPGASNYINGESKQALANSIKILGSTIVTATGNDLSPQIKALKTQITDVENQITPGVASRLGGAATAIGNAKDFTSKDPATVTAGVIGVLGGIAQLAPPPAGAAVGFVFNLMSSFIGLFSKKSNQPNPEVVMQNMINAAVKQIVDKVVDKLDDKLDKDELDQLKAAQKGTEKVYEISFGYLLSLAESGIDKLSLLELSSIPGNVPIYEGTDFMASFSTSMKQWTAVSDPKKTANAIQLLVLYSQLAIYRNLIYSEILMIYGANSVVKKEKKKFRYSID
eukprot:456214_1